MSKCKYCGKDVGWFKSCHSECEQKHITGMQQVRERLLYCFMTKRDFYLEEVEINRLIESSFIYGTCKETLFVDSLDSAVKNYLNDGIIDETEKWTVARFIQFSGLPQSVLNRNHAIEKILQAEIVQDILNGKKPQPKITIAGSVPFMLAKNETFLWLFREITFYEQKVHREYRGRSRGLSFRICKGVYYRIGSFKGTPIDSTYIQRIGTGNVCLTDRHFYFSCPEKSLKIPYNKVLNIETYSNGICLHKDGIDAKPLFFEGLDGWFCYNVIANLRE